MYSINKIYNLDCLEGLKLLPDECVDVCITSTPYWLLRDYNIDGQIGQEKTPEQFIQALVEVFRELRRVLKKSGTLWINIGDSYAAKKYDGIKPKDLVGIPWMLAFALRADGWYLRQDIIWSKPNPMPESVTDRCTKSHEYIFMLSKSNRYYYDYEAIKRPAAESSIARLSQDVENQKGSDRVPGKTNGNMKAVGKVDKQRGHSRRHAGFNERWGSMSVAEQYAMGANKRSVWEVATKPFKESHFATFPPELIIDCIKAGSPIDGLVLDPFMGAGTTALVSQKLNRNYVGFELNPDYIKIAEKRLKSDLGMFLKTEEIITNQLAIV
jgi:DNA modification methylase